MAQKLSGPVQVLRRTLRLERLTTIVDAGANPIDLTLLPAFWRRGGGAHRIGFEPQPEAYAALQAAKRPHESCFNHAAGDGGPVSPNLFRHSGVASTLMPCLAGHQAFFSGRSAQVLGHVTLQTAAPDALPDLAPFDLLKIDIQGGEVAVFNHAKAVLSNAVAVIVELRYHQLYEGEAMVGGVHTAWRAQGFTLHKFLFNKARMPRNSRSARLRPGAVADQLMDGDRVYIREPRRLRELPTSTVAHLALVAAAVLHSPAPALFCLDHLVGRKVIPKTLPAAYVDLLPAAVKPTPNMAQPPQEPT